MPDPIVTDTPTATHTPGEWRVEYDGPSLPIVVAGRHPLEIIALVRTDDKDARLIAAAPDLLAALEVASRWIDHVEHAHREIQPMTSEDATLIRAAIAKAKSGAG